MSRKPSTRESLIKFIERHPDAEVTGFYWYDGEYKVVILAATKGKRRESEAFEFAAFTAEQLSEVALEAGFEIGEPTAVEALCLSAGRSVKRTPPRSPTGDAK